MKPHIKASMRMGAISTLSALIAACVSVQNGASPASSAPIVSDNEGTLFVANKRGNTLSQIDLASGAEVRQVAACTNPHELATSPDGQHVALACYGGTTVDIFRASDLARVKSIELGENARPHGIAWLAGAEPGRTAIYVTAEGRKSIFAITYPFIDDPLDMIEVDTGQDGSHMLAVSPDNRFAWTVDMQSGTVTLIDLVDSRKVRSTMVGTEPEGIALTPDGKTLWISARGGDEAFALDPITLDIRGKVDTGAFPLRLAIRPQGDVAVTSNLEDGNLSVIDLATRKVVRTIAVSSPAEAQSRFQVTILWSPNGQRIYVAETGTDTVAEVDYRTGKVLRRLATGDGGDGMAIVSGDSE